MRNFSFHHLSSRVICRSSIQIISKQWLHLDSLCFLSWKHQSQNIARISHHHHHIISYSLQIASIESLSYSQNMFPHHWDTDSRLLNYSLRHWRPSIATEHQLVKILKTATSSDFECSISFVPCQHIICQKTDVPWRSMIAENLDPSCGFRLNWRGRVWLRCNCTRRMAQAGINYFHTVAECHRFFNLCPRRLFKSATDYAGPMHQRRGGKRKHLQDNTRIGRTGNGIIMMKYLIQKQDLIQTLLRYLDQINCSSPW